MSDITSKVDLNAVENIVHDDWELIDPTPDLLTWAKKFNGYFFENRLPNMKIVWNKKMSNCTGITEKIGNVIVISLSEPVLRYQSRKSTIDTLLHEMIHAYLFVKKQPSHHSKDFKMKMNEINNKCGTNIVIKHHFDKNTPIFFYRCKGPCGELFKSADACTPNNKWNNHHKRCDGYFVRVFDTHKEINNLDPEDAYGESNSSDIATNLQSNHNKSQQSAMASELQTVPSNGNPHHHRDISVNIKEEIPCETDEELNGTYSEVPLSDHMFANYDKDQGKLLSIAFLDVKPAMSNDRNVCIVCAQFVSDKQIFQHLFDCARVSAERIQYELPFYRIPSANE